jgi:tetratricopeptide (TPR) repeat protein
MRRILPFLLLWSSFFISAQNETLFNSGTEAYNQGDYNKAIESYLKILENGQHSAELYYNLGNSYYKLNQIAPSIYYYEKALLLKPNEPEIKNNLGYAQNMTLDAIETMPKTGLAKIYQNVVGIFSFDQWGYMAVGFMILFVVLYIAFYYLKYATQKRITLISGMLFLLMAITTAVIAFISYEDFKADRPAIVFSDEVIIKSEPNERSQEIFRLHEGTKLNVLEEYNDWKKIRIADGQMGWLSAESIKLLKDF